MFDPKQQQSAVEARQMREARNYRIVGTVLMLAAWSVGVSHLMGWVRF